LRGAVAVEAPPSRIVREKDGAPRGRKVFRKATPRLSVVS
jgi:hypothetical protein